MAKGFRCIFSNQGLWYLDHLDVPWQPVYQADPLEGITNATQQKLILGGEVCMWGETADTSDIQQTIWPRAAAAAGICTSHLFTKRTISSSVATILTSLGADLEHDWGSYHLCLGLFWCGITLSTTTIKG